MNETNEINESNETSAVNESAAANEMPAMNDLPEAPKKKKKALKIVLIIAAVLLALLIALGVIAFKIISALSKIEPTEDTSSAQTSDVSLTDVSGVTSEATESTGAENETEPSSGEAGETTVPNAEEPGTSAEAESTSAPAETQPDTTQSNTTQTNTTQPTTRKQQETTKAPEQTTKKQEPATAAPTQPVTEAPTTAAPVQGKNEYDIYRSGSFYVKGKMTDETGLVSPMELAITADTVYMLSEFDGVNIGLLHSGKDTYMIYPEKKAYMEFNSLLFKIMGADADELFDVSAFGFNRMDPLSEAISVSDENYKGVPCKKYVFKDKTDGTLSNVYMNGQKLVCVAALDSKGRAASFIDFDLVTDEIPENKKRPPSDYKKTGMIEFLSMLEAVV